MLKKTILGLCFTACLFWYGSGEAASNKAIKMAFVDVAAVAETNSNYASILKQKQAAEKNLKVIADQLTPLQAKMRLGKASSKEKQQVATLTKDLQAAQQKFNTQIKPKAEALSKVMNAAIAKVAKAQNLGVVLDRGIASKAGIIVYAAKPTDITALVIAEMKKAK